MTTRIFVIRERKHADLLWEHLRGWSAAAEAGKPLVVEVYPEGYKRSIRQNRLYWAMLHELAEKGWVEGNQYSAEAWHHYLAGRFLGYMETPGGRAPLTTSGLNVAEFNDYMQAVQVMAASELGIGLSLDDV